MKLISVDEVYKAIEASQPMVLIDVRTKEEFVRGHLKNSLHIPLDNISEDILKAIPDKETIIYIYCLSGSRSGVASALIERVGYRNVYSMQSGLLAWRSKGYHLVS